MGKYSISKKLIKKFSDSSSWGIKDSVNYFLFNMYYIKTSLFFIRLLDRILLWSPVRKFESFTGW